MRKITPLLILALVVLAGLALAEEPQVPPAGGTAQQQNLFQTFFNLGLWLQNISRDMARLERGASNLAVALVLLGFVYGVVQGIMGGGLEAIKGTFVRLAVAGLLLSLWNNGFIGNTVDRAMTAAREWGTDSSAATLSEAADNLDALALRIMPFMGAVGALKTFAAKTAKEVAEVSARTATAASATSAGAAKVLSYLNWATLLLIPMMLFFFILIVVASFTVEVGVALFPLAAALLIFPKGSAADWFGKWVAAVVGALLIVILLPVGFRAAVDLGINRPVYQVNAYVEQAYANIEAVKEQGADVMEEAATAGCSIVDVNCAISQRVKQFADEVSTTLQKIAVGLQAWLLGVILMLSGMAAAAYILFNIERVAMSFVGGFVATGVRQMLGTSSLGGRIYAGRAGGGGGAGTERTVVLPGERALPAGGSPGALPAGGGSLPRPAAYEMQPYSSSIQRYGDDVIEGEWRPVRELPNPSPKGLPPASSDS